MRYVLVAGAGYLLALVVFAAAVASGLPPYVALALAFVLNGLWNFFGVRRWAFPSSGRTARSELGRFAAVAAASLVINYAAFAVLYSVLELPPSVAQAGAIAVAAPFGFLANRLWSFRLA